MSEKPQITEFGRLVGYYLVDTGMTKKELCEKVLGCNPSTLARACDGTGKVPPEWMHKLPAKLALNIVESELKVLQAEKDRLEMLRGTLNRKITEESTFTRGAAA